MVVLEDDNNSKEEQSKGLVISLRVLSFICFIISIYCWFRAYDLDLGNTIRIKFNYESYVLVFTSLGIILMIFKENWMRFDKFIVIINVVSSILFCSIFIYLFIIFALS